MEARKEQQGDLPEIMTQREELGKKIAEKVAERNEIRDQYRQQEKEYWAYQAELRKIRMEKQQEESRKRQAEIEQKRKLQKAEKLDEQPYVQEMTLIEQTILFCKGLVQTKDSEAKEEKKEIAHNNPEGTQVLAKKEDREEFYFVPTAKKKGKSKNKGAKAEGSSKPIKHNAETFRLFDKLKLDAPITTDDVPETMKQLEAKLEMYQEKVRQWEENRDDMKRK